jgi:antitoxin component YwqK of YwqJK toxin-antitoxin module
MRTLLLYIFLTTYSLSLLAQQDYGFTDKAEAKNLIVNGKKEGKWVEYYNIRKGWDNPTKSKKAPIYCLIVYKDGRPCGVTRRYLRWRGKIYCTVSEIVDGNGWQKEYYESGKLMTECTFKNNMPIGIDKRYYESGKLMLEKTNTEDGRMMGAKEYYESGALKAEYPDDKGSLKGLVKEYYESGKLKRESTYSEWEVIKTVDFDENGNEIITCLRAAKTMVKTVMK